VCMTRTRIDEITGAIFLIGVGCLFYFGFWPGILFLLGGIRIVRGLAANQGWHAYQGAGWLIGVGVWALLDWSFPALMILLGGWMLITALFRRPASFAKPKPNVDNYFE